MVKRLLSVGECRVELVQSARGDYRQGFGGDALETARAARRALGPVWRVACFTALGDDAWSDRLIDYLDAEGIETDAVARLPGRVPSLTLIEDAGGRRAAHWREGAAVLALADDPESLESVFANAHAFYLSGITLALLAPDARGQLLAALDRAKARRATVVFDSLVREELWSDRGTLRAAIRAASRVATIALPSGPEEMPVFGDKGPEAVAARYQADGCGEVVVKAGTDAALAVWKGGKARIAPERRRAGMAADAPEFNGVYIAARLGGAGPEEAARHALAAALGSPQDLDAIA